MNRNNDKNNRNKRIKEQEEQKEQEDHSQYTFRTKAELLHATLRFVLMYCLVRCI